MLIIYISQFDMFQSKQTIYHVDRTVRETNATVYNGMEEIYVNTQAKGESDLTELMRIYTNTDAYNYERFPKTSIRKSHFKSNQEGVGKMCDIVEEYAKEYAEEQSKLALREAEEKMVVKLLKAGMPLDEIIEVMEMLTPEEVKELAEKSEL